MKELKQLNTLWNLSRTLKDASKSNTKPKTQNPKPGHWFQCLDLRFDPRERGSALLCNPWIHISVRVL